MKERIYENYECKETIRAVRDTIDVLGGKWRFSIVAALCFNKKRYSDLVKDVDGISGKMLSRELKDMEVNLLVKRTILDTKPITVQYELTEYGLKLKEVVKSLAIWGIEHRQEILRK